MKKYISFVSMIIIAGCSGQLSKDEIQKMDFGPLPENYQQMVKDHMSDPENFFSLKDPYTAIYRFEEPYKGSIWKGLLRGGKEYGWVIPVWVNAKNAFGAYTGQQKYEFLIRDGVLISP
jgi:hypothetical protein